MPRRLAVARRSLCAGALVLTLSVSLALSLSLSLTLSAAALADGDPASDVLLGENVFYPYTPPVSGSLQKTLNAETAAAAKQRFALKVALIASPVDLGVIPDLFGAPQKYADFLDQEISFQKKQPLLVVMPAGYGVQGMGPRGPSVVASLPKPAGKTSNDLARAAVVAVAALAKAQGHPLTGVPGAAGAGSGSGGSSTTILLVVLVVGAVVAASALGAITLRRRQAST
jgi:hypothetical protein